MRLILLTAALRGRLVRPQSLVVKEVKAVPVPPFETLEECTEAYDHCMGIEPVVAEPEYQTTTTTAPPPMKKAEVGQPERVEAAPAYKPPAADGTPDNGLGWDHNQHGDDWPDQCKGANQSPIDIVKYVDVAGQTKSVLWFDYYLDDRVTVDTKAELANRGHGVTYDDPNVDMGFVKIGTDEFEAYEWIVHTPSEHTIDGQLFPLELQVMHRDPSGKTLGVSILFKYGESNEFLAAIKQAVPALPKWTVEHGAVDSALTGEHPDVFDLEHLLPMGKIHPGGDMTFYNYEGSLTAPPCTEGVGWWVTASPVEATKDEISNFRSAIIGAESSRHGNNRATQPLEDRKVLVGHAGFQHHTQQHGHKQDVKPDSRGYSSQDTPWAAASKADEAEAEEETAA